MAMGDRVNFIRISLMPKSSNKMSAFDLPDQSATILGGHPHPSIMGGWLQSVWSPRSTGISFTTIKHRLHPTIAWGILNIDMPMCPHYDWTDLGISILCIFDNILLGRRSWLSILILLVTMTWFYSYFLLLLHPLSLLSGVGRASPVSHTRLLSRPLTPYSVCAHE